MRIESFQVNYFRSIAKSEPIILNQKTVIVGKNNEGKSNYLKAFNIALSILLDPRRAEIAVYRRRVLRDDIMFNWERDYPVNLQNKKRQPKTSFILVFDLTKEDIELFKEKVNNISDKLIVEIQISKSEFEILCFYIRKNKKVRIKEKEAVCGLISDGINFTYIPAIRTEKASLNIIDDLISQKLDILKENKEYLEAQQIIKEMQDKLLNDLSIELSEKIRPFVPDIKSVQLSTLYEARHQYGGRSDFKFIVNDGNPTEISYKGDGFKSLVTMALLNDRGQSDKNNIIAIEEPEAHLHSGAIHQLKEILNDVYKNNQILLTTHNQVFIDRDNISNNIIVDKGKIKKVKDLKQLRNILGVELSDNLISCEKVLLVEGPTDVKFLEKLLPILKPAIKDKIKKGQFIIACVGGTKHFIQYINFYKNVLCEVIILTDNDDAGRDVQNKLLSGGILESKSMYFVDNVSNNLKSAELENIIKPNYMEEIMIKYLPEFNLEEYEKSKIKWSEEIKRQYSQNGHLYNDDIEANLKENIVNYLIERELQTMIKSSSLEILKNLADRICQ